MSANEELHVLTYNIHKGYCSGNRRFVLESMRARIAETGADIVFLQEIHGTAIKSQSKRRRFSYPDQPHFEYLASEAWPHFAYGRNAIYRKGDHGNAKKRTRSRRVARSASPEYGGARLYRELQECPPRTPSKGPRPNGCVQKKREIFV